jgi:hypothetical protein
MGTPDVVVGAIWSDWRSNYDEDDNASAKHMIRPHNTSYEHRCATSSTEQYRGWSDQ